MNVLHHGHMKTTGVEGVVTLVKMTILDLQMDIVEEDMIDRAMVVVGMEAVECSPGMDTRDGVLLRHISTMTL